MIRRIFYWLGRATFEISTVFFYLSDKKLEVYYETSRSFEKYNITLRRKANEN